MTEMALVLKRPGEVMIMLIKFDNPKTRYFNVWAKNKSPFIVIAASILTAVVEECVEVLAEVKTDQPLLKDIIEPETDEWLSFYRNHRKLNKAISESFRLTNDETAEAVNFYEITMNGFKAMKGMKNKDLQKIWKQTPLEEREKAYNEVVRACKMLMVLFSDEKSAEVTKCNEDELQRIREFVNNPGIIFFLKVWAPCLLGYGIFPTQLYRKARQGDNKALEKIIRLDKRIMEDRTIYKIFMQSLRERKPAKVEVITTALRKTPKVWPEIKRVKYRIGGLLSLISIILGQKLTSAEIHRLFTAVAHDKGIRAEKDPDVCKDEETFDENIKRARKFWKALIPLPDSN